MQHKLMLNSCLFADIITITLAHFIASENIIICIILLRCQNLDLLQERTLALSATNAATPCFALSP